MNAMSVLGFGPPTLLKEPKAELDVSVVMPCLNEAMTITTCIDKAQVALRDSGLTYEIVIGDNGSTDGSQELARSHGARVIDIPRRGYGEAYRGAIAAARGRV